MERRAAFALSTGTIVAVLFAAIATGGEVELAQRSPSLPWATTRDTPVPATTEPTAPPDHRPPGDFRLRLPHIVDVAFQLLFVACVAYAAVLVVAYRVASPSEAAMEVQAPAAGPSPFDVVADMAAIIDADADAQRAALRHGSPRNAIVECWLRLEAAVLAAGVRQEPADTSTELTVRVITSYDVDSVAIERLAALYREARFSEHSMGEDARRAAIEALDEIHDGLRARSQRGGDDGVRSWKRPVTWIVGITIIVDLLMVLTDMGPNVPARRRARRSRRLSACGSSPTWEISSQSTDVTGLRRRPLRWNGPIVG